MKETSKELIVVDSLNPIELFAGDGMEPLLTRIETEVRSYSLDISTAAGREEVVSVAYKITRSKTTLDKMGKDLGEEYRKKVNALNAKRNMAVTRLESLRHEIRKPLTDWENAEKARVQKHQDGIADIKRLDMCSPVTPSASIQAAIERLSQFHGRDWQEFDSMAKTTISQVFESLTKKLEESKRNEAEREELARLRAAEQDRLKAEAEAKAAMPIEPTVVVPTVSVPAPTFTPKLAAPEDDRAAKNCESIRALCRFVDEKTAIHLLAAIAKGEIPYVTIKY